MGVVDNDKVRRPMLVLQVRQQCALKSRRSWWRPLTTEVYQPLQVCLGTCNVDSGGSGQRVLMDRERGERCQRYISNLTPVLSLDIAKKELYMLRTTKGGLRKGECTG